MYPESTAEILYLLPESRSGSYSDDTMFGFVVCGSGCIKIRVLERCFVSHHMLSVDLGQCIHRYTTLRETMCPLKIFVYKRYTLIHTLCRKQSTRPKKTIGSGEYDTFVCCISDDGFRYYSSKSVTKRAISLCADAVGISIFLTGYDNTSLHIESYRSVGRPE